MPSRSSASGTKRSSVRSPSASGRAARRGAVTLLAGLAAAWALVLVATPLAAGLTSDQLTTWEAVVRAAAARLCHQRPERSFLLLGHLVPVCGRCLALYVSGAIGLGIVAVLAWRRPHVAAAAPRPLWRGARLTPEATWLLAASLPALLVAGIEWWVVDPGTTLRAVASAPLGLAVGLVCGAGLARPTRRAGLLH